MVYQLLGSYPIVVKCLDGCLLVPTNHFLAALRWALFEIFVVTLIIDGAALRGVCLRVRPQGERAVFIRWFDCA